MDPVTQAQITVESVDALATLVTEMNGVTLRMGYDMQSGVLESLEIRQAVNGSTIRLQLADSSQPG